MISVIVPVRGEAVPPEDFLDRLVDGKAELVVAATTSTPDSTLEAYGARGARVLTGDGPRGQRLSQAAQEAAGDVLLFLHADTLLPRGWDRMVGDAISAGAVGGAFQLAFAGGGARMRWVAFWANRRTRLTRIPYGDQAPFVRRDVYRRLGGHKPWSLLEDVELGKRLRDEGPVALLPAPALTSPRRYEQRGVTRTVLGNWYTLIRFRLGADPERLAEEYRRR